MPGLLTAALILFIVVGVMDAIEVGLSLTGVDARQELRSTDHGRAVTGRLLHGLLVLVTRACTIIVFVIVLRVIMPRRQQHRSVRVPATVGLVIGVVGLSAAVVNFILTLNS